jgi:aspartate/tyrosine/aromatic aminotransferase
MIKDHHIYMTKNGRISMAGVFPGNVEYIGKAMAAVSK